MRRWKAPMSVEPDSATWRAVKAFAVAEIEKSREALEHHLPGAVDNSPFHRGRIKALREVIALAAPVPLIEASTKLY